MHFDDIAMFALKPDFEICKRRMDAFWEGELFDRPVVQFTLEKPAREQQPLPESLHAAPAERWMNAEYQAQYQLITLSNQVFLGDSMPIAWPNLGPDVFTALYGCQLHFGNYGTSWSEPVLLDWKNADQLLLDWNSVYLNKLDEMTDVLLEAGKGIFLTGITDLHVGGDALAALRGTMELAVDLINQPDAVRQLLRRLELDYFKLYDHFYQKLRAAEMPISTWVPLVCDGKFYIPSNDFSFNISAQMFDDFFLPGMRRECQFLDHSLYHLDGTPALRHLESLLSIPELNAVQFVPDPGHESIAEWIRVYQRIQAAGKGVQVCCDFSELDLVMQTLDPHGLLLTLNNVPGEEAAEHLLIELERWCLKRPPGR